jgi:ParB family chromosome partitioning protein
MSTKLGGNLRSAMQQAKREALNQSVEVAGTSLLLSQIVLPDSQPRRYFDPDATETLKRSIEEKGILQPLLVRPVSENAFELVAGERRYRAARELGLAKVPVTIRELSDLEAAEVALAENLQREDLNPIEETEGVLKLLALKLEMDRDDVVSLLYGLQNAYKGKITHNNMGNAQETVERTLEAVGRMTWQSFVTNRLPLLKLPEDVLEILREGRLPYTKALVLARVKDPEKRQALLQRTLTENLSVAELRRGVQQIQTSAADPADSLDTRARNLSKLLRRNPSLRDEMVKKRVEDLLNELEKLLRRTP